MTQRVFIIRMGRSRLSLTRDQVKGLLLMAGLSLTDTAEVLGCSLENLSRLLNGRGEFPRIEQKLLKELERIAPVKMRAAS